MFAFLVELFPIVAAAGRVLRVPALAAFFAGLAGQVIGWFAQWFTRRTAINLGIVTVITGLTVAIFVAVKASIAGLALVVPDFVRQGLDMVIPSNFLPCASMIFAANITRWVWIWKVHFIEMAAGNGN